MLIEINNIFSCKATTTPTRIPKIDGNGSKFDRQTGCAKIRENLPEFGFRWIKSGIWLNSRFLQHIGWADFEAESTV